MLDIDGLAVTRGIKVQHSGTSVIIFTMYENPDHLLEALRSGAAGYLLKGASRAEILTAVRQVLAGESLLHPELVLQMLHRLADTAEAPVRAERLTRREQDVLGLVAVGRRIARSPRPWVSTRARSSRTSSISSRSLGSRTAPRRPFAGSSWVS
jgi:DNA-binding NarL/FixJ family response regulator